MYAKNICLDKGCKILFYRRTNNKISREVEIRERVKSFLFREEDNLHDFRSKGTSYIPVIAHNCYRCYSQAAVTINCNSQHPRYWWKHEMHQKHLREGFSCRSYFVINANC